MLLVSGTGYAVNLLNSGDMMTGTRGGSSCVLATTTQGLDTSSGFTDAVPAVDTLDLPPTLVGYGHHAVLLVSAISGGADVVVATNGRTANVAVLAVPA
jgi:hypothetical protein